MKIKRGAVPPPGDVTDKIKQHNIKKTEYYTKQRKDRTLYRKTETQQDLKHLRGTRCGAVCGTSGRGRFTYVVSLILCNPVCRVLAAFFCQLRFPFDRYPNSPHSLGCHP